MSDFQKFCKTVGLNYFPDNSQQKVITHPFDEPLLVLAGAGAGKTETMANRIVYMLYRDKTIHPSQILGITFTNKAVLELKERVHKRVKTLKGNVRSIDEYPEVMTYNSFATSIVQDFGLINGEESNMRIITSADRYLLVREAVLSYYDKLIAKSDNSQTDDIDIKVETLIKCSIELIDIVDNNLLDENIVEREIDILLSKFHPDEFKGRNSKEYSSQKKEYISNGNNSFAKAYAVPKEIPNALKSKKEYLEVIKKYRELKKRNNVIDFSDQIKMAVKIVKEHQEVREYYRKKYQYVILDEYQDTSASQVELLKIVFGQNHPIIAVGDPNQAIYEWRGASSSGILRFTNHFNPKNKLCQKVELLTSRRNSKKVLTIANKITDSLTNSDGQKFVSSLLPAENAKEGNVEVKLCAIKDDNAYGLDNSFTFFNDKQKETFTNLGSETTAVIEYIKKHFVEYNKAAHKSADGKKRTAAILCPIKKDFEIFKSALDKEGILCQINGLGGLLELPEIQDILAYLYVADDSRNHPYMLRILTSPKVNINPKALKILKSYANKLQQNVKNSEKEGIINIIKDIGSRDDLQYAKLAEEIKKNVGGEIYQKLEHIGSIFNALDKNKHIPLDEFVSKVVYYSNVETEVVLYQKINSKYNQINTSPIDLFKLQVQNFARKSSTPTLQALLHYFEIAASQENGFDMPLGKTNPDAVQLITIHGAKGLEWDVVCCVSNTMNEYLHDSRQPYKSPNKSEKGPIGLLVDFPNYPLAVKKSWLNDKSSLPDHLRLDKDDLQPLIDLTAINDIFDYDLKVSSHELAHSQRLINERRRLSYVAFTRAKTHLLITASLFQKNKKFATLPTPFWINAFSALGEDISKCTSLLNSIFYPVINSSDLNSNPIQKTINQNAIWPDFDSQQKNIYANATANVAQKFYKTADVDIKSINNQNLIQLYNEYLELCHRRDNWQKYVKLPQNLSTSALVKLNENREQFLKDITRPLPQKPITANEIGTKFHNFVQNFFTSDDFSKHLKGQYVYQSDNLPASLSIDNLVNQFLLSSWSKTEPLLVEKEFEFIVNSHLIIARIDAIFVDKNDPSQIIIVDWKTGSIPRTKEDKFNKAVQLAWYREAFLRDTQNQRQNVSAGFIYVREGDAGAVMFSADELDKIIETTKVTFE